MRTRFLPRSRFGRFALLLGGLMALYLLALSLAPRLFGDDTASDHERARAALAAPNWSLVLPDDRAALGRAVDAAWRELTSYHSRYVSGLPAALAADDPETVSESFIRLDGRGRVTAQRDSNLITSRSPVSNGREARFEGFRIRSNQPYLTSKGKKVGQAELVYQRNDGGAWTCERGPADSRAGFAPALDFREAGEAGALTVDGRPARAFTLPNGAFGLRSAATVWIDVATLHVVRQEIVSTLPGRREVWTFDRFNEPLTITPPAGISCQEG